MSTFVNLFILPFYVSDVLKVDAKALGFLLMLTPVIAGSVAPIGGWLSDRMPPAYLTTTALVVSAAAMFWFSTLTGTVGTLPMSPCGWRWEALDWACSRLLTLP